MTNKVISVIIILVFLATLSACTKMYTVTFDSMGGSEVSSVSVEEGNIVDVPSTLREGYTFDGWYTSLDNGDSLSDEWIFSVNPVTRDVILYAKWIPETYNLKVNSYQGIKLFDEEIEFGTSIDYILESLNPSRRGYIFLGWDIDFPQFMPANDLELTAVYELGTYSILFIDFDGEVLQSNNYKYGDSLSDLTFPQEPIRDGLDFDGWISEFRLHDITLRTMPSHDIIIQAEYNRIVTIEELVTNPDMYIGLEITVVGTITRKVGRHGYIQDGEFGVYVYTGFEYTTKFQVGNTVVLHDVVPTYYPDQETGALQLSGFRARNLETLFNANFVEPKLISINDLSDEMIGSLIEVHQLTIVDVYSDQDGAFNVYVEDELGNELTLRKDSSSSSDIDITDYTIGKVINIIGPVHVINSEKVIMITSNEDVTFID